MVCISPLEKHMFTEKIDRTSIPITTSQCVIAIIYKDGIMMSSSRDIYYGNTLKFRNVPSIFGFNNAHTLVGFTGEYSDAQYIIDIIRELELKDSIENQRNNRMEAYRIWGHLSQLFYSKRRKFDPLWNEVVVAGRNPEKEWFLGYTDLYGTTYKDNIIATGVGAHFALPILRDKSNVNMEENDARELIIECMKIIYSRTCRFSNNIEIAKITNEGITKDDIVKLNVNWHSIE